MAFDPPLGSTSPAVLADNASRLDKLLNGTEPTVPDRSGEALTSWAGIELATRASGSAMAFPNVTQLLAFVPQTANVLAQDTQTGTFYYWNGTAWSQNAYQVNKAIIAAARLTIAKPGKNKFNYRTVTSGYYLFEGTGVPAANADYAFSDYIAVRAGLVHSLSPGARVVTFYDTNFLYLSDISSVTTFTVPSGAAFARLSVSVSALETFQMETGVAPTPFEAYRLKLPAAAENVALDVLDATGFKPGKNLFDPLDVISQRHLSSVGTILYDTDLTMSVSGYIQVTPGVQVCCNQQWKAAAWYDANGAFISRQYDASFATKAIAALVIPATAAYLRIEVLTTNLAVTQVELGALATAFEPFRLVSPTSLNAHPLRFGEEPATLASMGLFVPGANLFNAKTAKFGYINEFGVVFPVASGSNNYYYSDYIPVTAGDVLRASASLRFVNFLSASKALVSSITSTTQFTVPAGVAFMRVSTLQANVASLQIVKGAYLPTREDYMAVLASALADGTPVRIPGGLIDTSSLAVDFVKQGLLVVGKNRYNRLTIQAGYINETGAIVAGGTTWVYSDFIPVKPNTTYVLNLGARFMGFYAANKAWMRTEASAGQTLTTITTDADCYFLRVTMAVGRGQTLQLEEGTTSTTYEEFAYSYLTQLADGTPVKGTGINTSTAIPDDYGLERLRETHMRLMKMTFGELVRFVIANIGDSYTRTNARYALKVAQKLWNKFHGTAITSNVPPIGYGYRSFGFDANGDNTDVIGVNVNQSSGVTCAYNIGHGPDISSVTMTAAGDTISYVQNLTLGFDSFLYVEGGAGVIQYQAAGMSAPTVIDLTTYAAGMQIIPMTLPSTGIATTVTITANTAPAVLYGVKILNQTAAGILVHKLGGSGSSTAHWVNGMDSRWLTAFQDLGADLVTIMLGTNDQGASMPAATYRNNLLTMIDRIRSVRPAADILLVCPAENNRPGGNTIPMATYAEVMYKIARDDRDVAFLNLQASFGAKASDYALSGIRPWMVSDGLHPDPATGGYAIASAILHALSALNL
ncbi:TPA: GDSL-type esterase/lipase family protein [Klebsiella variicola]